jgi:hypothetical protein
VRMSIDACRMPHARSYVTTSMNLRSSCVCVLVAAETFKVHDSLSIASQTIVNSEFGSVPALRPVCEETAPRAAPHAGARQVDQRRAAAR